MRKAAWREVPPGDGAAGEPGGPATMWVPCGDDASAAPRASMPPELAIERGVLLPNLLDPLDEELIMQPDVLGVAGGFSQPNGVVHLDTVQVRRFSGYWDGDASRRRAAATASPGLYGLSIFLGMAIAAWSTDRGCSACELLAINDAPRQHATLKRYCGIIGFEVVREVGEDLSSFGDRLVWGGEGALMRADLPRMMKRFRRLVTTAEPPKPSSALAM